MKEISFKDELEKPVEIKIFNEIESSEVGAFGGKATNLAILKRAGLPVPDGLAISVASHEYFNLTGEVAPNVISVAEKAFEKFGGKIAIRSSATIEDSRENSMAGVFTTEYVTDKSKIKVAIEKIYRQANSPEVANYLKLQGMSDQVVQMGLIVQQLIDTNISGVIYTGVEGNKILIQYATGMGVNIVDGKTQGTTILVDPNKKNIIESNNFGSLPIQSGEVSRLIDHSNKIKRVFGVEQDIEFGIKDSSIYILQARPLTTKIEKVDTKETVAETLERIKTQLKLLVYKEKNELGTQSAVFTTSNFIELLPNPKEMDLGIFAYIFSGSDNVPGGIQLGRKDMGYSIGRESIGMMQYVGGKPYTSLSRDAATFYAGFPKSSNEYFQILVNEYLSIVEGNPDKANYPEMKLYLQDPTFQDLQKRFGSKAPEYFKTYQMFVQRMDNYAETFLSQFKDIQLPKMAEFFDRMSRVRLEGYSNQQLADYVYSVLEHLRTKSCVNFVKAARLGFYYSQKTQNILKEQTNLNTKQVEEIFAKLSQGLGSMITEANIKIVEAESYLKRCALLQSLWTILAQKKC